MEAIVHKSFLCLYQGDILCIMHYALCVVDVVTPVRVNTVSSAHCTGKISILVTSKKLGSKVISCSYASINQVESKAMPVD